MTAIASQAFAVLWRDHPGYYIIGEEVLYEMMDGIAEWNDNWNNIADDETNAAILAELDE